MPVTVRAVGAIAPNPSASSLGITIPPSWIDSALVALGYFNSAGTRSFSSSGSSWTQQLDDGINRAIWSAIPAAPGTTLVTADNGGVNSHLTLAAIEAYGLKPGGRVLTSTVKIETGVQDWTTNSITPDFPCLAFAYCTQLADGSISSVPTHPWTPLTGTGLSNGNVLNGNEGDAGFVAFAVFPRGATIVGGGRWSSPINTTAYLIAFEIEPELGGVNSPAHPGRGPSMSAYGFRPTPGDQTVASAGAVLDAAIACQCTGTADLSTSIALQASAAASCTLAAGLSTQIRLAAAAQAAATVSADLTVGSSLAATITVQCTAAAALGTSIRLGAAISSTATLSAALSTAVRLAASVAAQCSVSGTLTTAIRLAAAAQASATVSPALTTAVRLAVQVIASAQASAALSTQIQLQASVQGQTTLAAALSVSAAVGGRGVRTHLVSSTTSRGSGGEPLSRAQPKPLRRT